MKVGNLLYCIGYGYPWFKDSLFICEKILDGNRIAINDGHVAVSSSDFNVIEHGIDLLVVEDVYIDDRLCYKKGETWGVTQGLSRETIMNNLNSFKIKDSL